MGKNPKTIHVDAMAIDALDTMENNRYYSNISYR